MKLGVGTSASVDVLTRRERAAFLRGAQAVKHRRTQVVCIPALERIAVFVFAMGMTQSCFLRISDLVVL